MEFEINKSKWTIEVVSKDQMKLETDNNYTMGLTIYMEQRVLLCESQANIIKTLKHELVHVWLYEYGHSQNEKGYSYEEVCEIVASSNEFINEIVNKYMEVMNMNRFERQEMYEKDHKVGKYKEEKKAKGKGSKKGEK